MQNEETAMTHALKAELTTIAALDVPRYLGTWYEIAKFPNRFQKKCVGNAKAEYNLKDDGTVQVINRCTLASGKISQAIGVARQLGSANSPKLEVRFAPACVSFTRQSHPDMSSFRTKSSAFQFLPTRRRPVPICETKRANDRVDSVATCADRIS